MIAQSQLQKLSVKYQTNELNVIREYLQHLFLSLFYQQPQSNEIYFKGGTALRFVYQSPRFSEDLDFATNKANVPGIEELLLGILEKIEKENIGATLQEAKNTTGGYLAIIDFMIFDKIIPIRIEISFREKKDKGELVTITSDFAPPYTAVILLQEQLVAGKMQALRERKKPRDFYDLYFILRSRLPIPNKKELFPQVLDILKKTDINFAVELKQFLPKSQWMVIKDFKSILEREIKRND